jgi:hypothetical protein
MARKYFNEVYYRAAATPVSTFAYSSGISGWTKLVGAVADKAKSGLEGIKEKMGDGTEHVQSEKAAPEIIVKEFTAANYSTIRSAFLNTKVDILLIDTEQKSPAYVAWGIILYPKLDIAGGEEPQIVLSGEREAGAAITNLPFTLVTIT